MTPPSPELLPPPGSDSPNTASQLNQHRSPSDVAWALVLNLSPHLSKRERNRIFAKVGAGEAYAAIEEVLTTARRKAIPLSEELLRAVSDLSRAYQGRAASTLRMLIDDLRRTQDEGAQTKIPAPRLPSALRPQPADEPPLRTDRTP